MNPKLMMFFASVIGALFGMLVMAAAKPDYDFFVWVGLFAIIGVGAGNLVLLILYEILKD